MNKIKLIGAIIFCTVTIYCRSQDIIITGRVLDTQAKLPLLNASVSLQSYPLGTSTDYQGRFTLPLPANRDKDTLIISYVGYRTLKKTLMQARADSIFLLQEAPTILDEITVLARSQEKFGLKKLEQSMRIIRDSLYATDMEVTNQDYNKFLSYLLQSGQESLYRQYKPDISEYEGSLLAFFKAYHTQATHDKEKAGHEYDNYSVVNITYEAAMAYCAWLTEQYNSSKGKHKFNKATFRLPTRQEWQIMALGYSRFQSWDIEENELVIHITPAEEMLAGQKVGQRKVIPFKGSDIRYPWFSGYTYRNNPQNNKNCWLGNFKLPDNAVSCNVYRTSGDGYAITGKCGSYFPNDMGFYDVVGNVAEMINIKGKACGGSWNHYPEESTITSVMNYSKSSGTVGFRVFMEVMSPRQK